MDFSLGLSISPSLLGRARNHLKLQYEHFTPPLPQSHYSPYPHNRLINCLYKPCKVQDAWKKSSLTC